jgi:hypothetical protein
LGRSDDGDLGAPTTYLDDVNGGAPSARRRAHHQRKEYRQWASWEAVPEIRERSPSALKTSMTAPLGGDVEDPGAPTINGKKCRWRTPWEAMPEIQERPP